MIFDRSWYGRVLVERIEGFAFPHEWNRAYLEINDFEEQLTEAGIAVAKFWIHLSKDEQLRRFRERESTSFKRHKITPEDWRNRKRWDAYKEAVNDMVARTSTEYAPWTLVAGNDKKFARVQILKTLCEKLTAALCPPSRGDSSLSFGVAPSWVTGMHPGRFARGNFIGEMAFWDRGARSADAITTIDVPGLVVSRALTKRTGLFRRQGPKCSPAWLARFLRGFDARTPKSRPCAKRGSMTSRRTTQPRPSAVDRLIEAFERLRRKKKPPRNDLSERVHFVRVQCKRLNALLRLARPHVAKTAYVTARNRVKSAARALSLARDRDVIAKTLRSSIARLPARKRRTPRRWMRTGLTPGDPDSIRKHLDQADRKLESVVRRFPRPRDPVQSLRRFSYAGVKRSYREAREGLRDVLKRNRPEDFHRWRKWTKCLQLQLALLDSAGLRVDGEIPRALDELQRRLGMHRDLLLAENFAAGQGAAPKALLKLLRRRRVRLERKLLKCGRRFFSAKPAQFARRVLEMAS